MNSTHEAALAQRDSSGALDLDNQPDISRVRDRSGQELSAARDVKRTIGGQVAPFADRMANKLYQEWLTSTGDELAGSTCRRGAAVRDDGAFREVIGLPCGKWSCPSCGKRRYWWFRKNVERAVAEHRLTVFWTLTIWTDTMSPAESWERIAGYWNRIRTELVDAHPGFLFIWVVEPTEAGYAHLHFLTNAWVHHDEMRARWCRITGGSKVVRFERVRDTKVSHYLAKYVGKTAGMDLKVPDGVDLTKRHRFGKSHAITFTEFRKPAGGWQWVPDTYDELLAAAVRERRLVVPPVGPGSCFLLRLGPAAGYEWQWQDARYTEPEGAEQWE